MTNSSPSNVAQSARQDWMAVLSRASTEELETCWQSLASQPAYRLLRAPECAMVMLRGRTGGSGAPFNLGEVTVTRCAVSLDDGTTGMSWTLGRDKRHSELAAIFDALLQREPESLKDELIEPCRNQWSKRRQKLREESAATRVDFFTLVRGENE